MPFEIQAISYPLALYGGGILLLAGLLICWSKKEDAIGLFGGLCLADAGYILAGFGIGGAAAGTGAALFLFYALTARALAFVCLNRMVQAGQRSPGALGTDHANASSFVALQGMGRIMPCSATMYAFAMFAAMGVSPFLTPEAKPFVLYGALLTFQPIVVGFLVLGNLAVLVFTVYAVHKIWLQSRPENAAAGSSAVAVSDSGSGAWLMRLLAAALVLLGLFGHQFAFLVSNLLGYAYKELPVFSMNWSPAVLVPYAGAFMVYLVGLYKVQARNTLAILVMAAAFALVLADTGTAPLGRLFAVISSGIGVLVTVYSCGYIHGSAGKVNGYFFFLLLMFGSLSGLALCDNLGGFYVFWELMTLSSYVLVAYEGTPQAHRAAVKYFLMCGLAAGFMLPGLLFLGVTGGSLDIAGLAGHIQLSSFGVMLAGVLTLIGFGVKAGLVPGHSWLPDAHPAAPSSISAPLSGVLTKSGIFGLMQIMFIIFGYSALNGGNAAGMPALGVIVTTLGIATMLYGEIQALRQKDLKRLLAFSTMGQIGEITITLGLCTYLAASGAMLHMLNHAIMKDLLFLASGALILRSGSRNLEALRGLGRKMPLTALCMVVGLVSILGLPPFAGFMSKFSMLYALAQTHFLLAALLLLASMAGCVYYTRIIKTLIFEPYEGKAGQNVAEAPKSMLVPMLVLSAASLALGMFPQIGMSLVSPVLDSLSASGHLAVQILPNLQLSWQPFTLLLMVGALLPVMLKRNPRLAGQATAGMFALAALLVLIFGRSLDDVSFYFALIVCLVGMLNIIYNTGYMAHGHAQWRFYGCFTLMCAGLTGVAASRDLFNFFFFWELMSSWTLYFAIVHEETAEALREGFKYFFFNVLGAAFLFLGVVLLGNWAGGFDFDVVAAALGDMHLWQTSLALGVMAVGFVMKAAQLPLRIDIQMHPASAPTPVSGYISSVLLKSAVFGLVKLFLVLGGAAAIGGVAGEAAGMSGSVGGSLPVIMQACVWIGGVTIVMAAALAVFQSDIKLVLIYSTVSQIGYMVVAVALGTSLGIAGGLLHLVNHVLFKDLLFLVAGAVIIQTGRQSMDSLGGLGRLMPKTMMFFFIGAMCVIGVPPSNGFTSKWIIYHALMQQGFVLVAVLSLVGSVLTLAYLAKMMHSVFLGQTAPGLEQVEEASFSMIAPMWVLSAGCIITSVFPGVVLLPINEILSQFNLAVLDVALWGIASGAGAWNATATAVLFAVAWGCGKFVLSRFAVRERKTDVHTCGIPPEELNLRTTSQDIYSEPYSKRLGWLIRKAAGKSV